MKAALPFLRTLCILVGNATMVLCLVFCLASCVNLGYALNCLPPDRAVSAQVRSQQAAAAIKAQQLAVPNRWLQTPPQLFWRFLGVRKIVLTESVEFLRAHPWIPDDSPVGWNRDIVVKPLPHAIRCAFFQGLFWVLLQALFVLVWKVGECFWLRSIASGRLNFHRRNA